MQIMAKRFVKEYANFEKQILREIPGIHDWDLERKVEKINKYVGAYERGLICEREAMGKISEIASDDVIKYGVPNTFYTGGGIWVTVMFNGMQNHYYAIDNNSINIGQECLTLYTDGFSEYDDTPFMEMAWSKGIDELSHYRKGVYDMMKADLEETMTLWG